MDYSAREALGILVEKITQRSPELARLVQAAVNEGKFIEERELLKGNKARKTHTYRKLTKLSDKEALEKAIAVLESYFIELPLCVASLTGDLANAVLVEPEHITTRLPLFENATNAPVDERETRHSTAVTIFIDMGHEAIISPRSEEKLLELHSAEIAQIEQQKQNIAKVRSMLGEL